MGLMTDPSVLSPRSSKSRLCDASASVLKSSRGSDWQSVLCKGDSCWLTSLRSFCYQIKGLASRGNGVSARTPSCAPSHLQHPHQRHRHHCGCWEGSGVQSSWNLLLAPPLSGRETSDSDLAFLSLAPASVTGHGPHLEWSLRQSEEARWLCKNGSCGC